MESEYARQTRWALPPDPVDPARIPAGACYVRQVVWLPCTECDLQVHAPLVQLLAEGVACPECGRQLAVPIAVEQIADRLRQVMDAEENFRQELAREETPCCD
jgi:hypothetical protein